MAANTKTIKRRMKSITNTKKITKAMELVSASKMRRAVEATLATRPYATMAREIMERLSRTEKAAMPLLATRPVGKVLIVLIAATRGLCGSFNTNLYKKTANLLRDPRNLAQHRMAPPSYGHLPFERGGQMSPPFEGGEAAPPTGGAAGVVSIDVLGIGKKSAWIAKKLNLNLIGVFEQLGERPSMDEVLSVTKVAIDDFVAEKYDKVIVVYTDYKSSLAQIPKVRQVLPISEIDLEKMVTDQPPRHASGVSAPPFQGGEKEVAATTAHLLGKEGALRPQSEAGVVDFGVDLDDYLFEPNRTEILSTILPRLVEVQLYQAVLESSASEQSARMVAMKNATEAAGDMLQELRLNFNKARQAAITQEISEIVGGAAALG